MVAANWSTVVAGSCTYMLMMEWANFRWQSVLRMHTAGCPVE